MEATDQTTARLHQEASTHYLQGRFNEALEVWRRLLANDPEDERAKEGVRLCELLTEEAGAEGAATPVEVTPEAAQAIEDPIDFEVPELEIDLPEDTMVLSAEPVQPVALPDAPVASAIPEADFEAPDDAFVVVDGEPEPGQNHAIENDVMDAAASELAGRVEELLHEARTAYAQGDQDTARSVLARLFILDSAHAAAHELQEQIEADTPAVGDFVDTADLDAPDHGAAPGDFDLNADAPEGELVTAEAEAIPLEAHEAMPLDPEVEQGIPLEMATESMEDAQEIGEFPEDDLPMDDVDSQDELLELPGLGGKAASPAPAKAKKAGVKLPHLAFAGRAKWIALGVVALAVAAVGIGFWMKLQSVADDGGVGTPVTPQAQSAPAAGSPEAATGGPGAGATPAPTEDVPTLLAQGREAMASEDYAAAIVAYHAVIAQDPGNAEAAENMEVATEAYKEQQEVQREWDSARELFNGGEYRSAMKMFYRLPVESDADAARLESYRLAGWYNMAVNALRSSQCDLAISHLNEAEAIDPADETVANARALVESCNPNIRESAYLRAANALPMRALDD